MKWCPIETIDQNSGGHTHGSAYNHLRLYNKFSDIDTSNPKTNSIQFTFTQANDYLRNTIGAYPSDFSAITMISRGAPYGGHEWAVFTSTHNTSWASSASMSSTNGMIQPGPSTTETHTISHRGTNKIAQEIRVDFKQMVDPSYIAIGGVMIRNSTQAKGHRVYLQTSRDGTTWEPKYLTWTDSSGIYLNTESSSWFDSNYSQPSSTRGIFKIEDSLNYPKIPIQYSLVNNTTKTNISSNFKDISFALNGVYFFSNQYIDVSFSNADYTTNALSNNTFFTVHMKNTSFDFSANFFYKTMTSSQIASVKSAALSEGFVSGGANVPDCSYDIVGVNNNNVLEFRQEANSNPFTSTGASLYSITKIDVYNGKGTNSKPSNLVVVNNVSKCTMIANYSISSTDWGIYEYPTHMNTFTWHNKIGTSSFYNEMRTSSTGGTNNEFGDALASGVTSYFYGPSEFELEMNTRHHTNTSQNYGHKRVAIIWPKDGNDISLGHWTGATNGVHQKHQISSAPEPDVSYIQVVGNDYTTKDVCYNYSFIGGGPLASGNAAGRYVKIILTDDWKMQFWSKTTPSGTYTYYPNKTKDLSGTDIGGGINNSNTPFILMFGGGDTGSISTFKTLTAKTNISITHPLVFSKHLPTPDYQNRTLTAPDLKDISFSLTGKYLSTHDVSFMNIDYASNALKNNTFFTVHMKNGSTDVSANFFYKTMTSSQIASVKSSVASDGFVPGGASVPDCSYDVVGSDNDNRLDIRQESASNSFPGSTSQPYTIIKVDVYNGKATDTTNQMYSLLGGTKSTVDMSILVNFSSDVVFGIAADMQGCTISSNTVTSLKPITKNGKHKALTVPGGSQAPDIATINGYKYFTFNGSNQILQAPSTPNDNMSGENAFTFMIAWKHNPVRNYETFGTYSGGNIHSNALSNTKWFYEPTWADGTNSECHIYDFGHDTTPIYTDTTNPALSNVLFTHMADDNISFFIKGGSTWINRLYSFGGVTGYTTDRVMKGSIYEIRVYDSRLTDSATRINLVKEIRNKYALKTAQFTYSIASNSPQYVNRAFSTVAQLKDLSFNIKGTYVYYKSSYDVSFNRAQYSTNLTNKTFFTVYMSRGTTEVSANFFHHSLSQSNINTLKGSGPAGFVNGGASVLDCSYEIVTSNSDSTPLVGNSNILYIKQMNTGNPFSNTTGNYTLTKIDVWNGVGLDGTGNGISLTTNVKNTMEGATRYVKYERINIDNSPFYWNKIGYYSNKTDATSDTGTSTKDLLETNDANSVSSSNAQNVSVTNVNNQRNKNNWNWTGSGPHITMNAKTASNSVYVIVEYKKAFTPKYIRIDQIGHHASPSTPRLKLYLSTNGTDWTFTPLKWTASNGEVRYTHTHDWIGGGGGGTWYDNYHSDHNGIFEIVKS